MSWPDQAHATTIGRPRVVAGVTAVGVPAGGVLWMAGERSLAWLAWTLIAAPALIPLTAGLVGEVALGRAAWVSGGADPGVPAKSRGSTLLASPGVPGGADFVGWDPAVR